MACLNQCCVPWLEAVPQGFRQWFILVYLLIDAKYLSGVFYMAYLQYHWLTGPILMCWKAIFSFQKELFISFLKLHQASRGLFADSKEFEKSQNSLCIHKAALNSIQSLEVLKIWLHLSTFVFFLFLTLPLFSIIPPFFILVPSTFFSQFLVFYCKYPEQVFFFF